MFLEASRLVADWFADSTHGVNALLPSTPVDAGDSTPAALATITDWTRNGDAARDEVPQPRPALSVSVDAIEDLDGQVVTVTRDGRMKLRIRVGVDNATSEDAVRDLSYYLRTVIRSWKLLFSDAHNTDRNRNSIYLETTHSIASAIVAAKDPAGNTLYSGYVLPVVQLRDKAP